MTVKKKIKTYECNQCSKEFIDKKRHWHIPIGQIIELVQVDGQPIEVLQVGHCGSDPDVYEPDKHFCTKKCLLKYIKHKVDMVDERWD